MALFGPRYKDLPLLTHFYQVEGDEEMSVMLGRLSDSSPFPFRPKVDPDAKRINDLHGLAKRLMDRALEGQCQWGDVEEFNKYLKSNGRWFGFRGQVRGLKYLAGRPRIFTEYGVLSESTLLPLSVLAETRYNHNVTLRDWETKIVYELKEMLQNDGKNLARCQECHSVFVASRRGQSFCSHRCGNRKRQQDVRENRLLVCRSDSPIRSLETTHKIGYTQFNTSS